MSTEQNKAIARRSIEELWNDRNVEVIDELFAEDYHEPGRKDRRAFKEFAIAVFAAGVPSDIHITIEDQIAEGDRVVTRWTWRFTHSVPFLGAAPTGKHISFTGISIYRLEGGKIVEGWFNNDELGLNRQLGLIAQVEENMSTEQNKAIAYRSIDELWNGRNVEVIDELFTEDYRQPGANSRRAWKEEVITLFAAGVPPDFHITIEDQIAEGDKVVTRWTWRFTHTVPFLGAAPTGKHISFTGISIYRLEGGKIVEGWFNNDELGLNRQLGKIA